MNQPLPPQKRVEYPDNASIDPYDPTTFGFIPVGYIRDAHGVHGEVKIKADSDFGTDRLCTPGFKGLRRKGKRFPRDILLQKGRPGGGEGDYIVKFEGVDDRLEAAKMKGAEVFVREREDEPIRKDREEGEEEEQEEEEEERNEWVIKDLVGLPVYHGNKQPARKRR